MKPETKSNTKPQAEINTVLAVSGLRTKDVQTAANKHASEILGIPPDEVLPDDTIVNGFMAGVWWALSQAACASGAVDTGVCVDCAVRVDSCVAPRGRHNS